ncbi:MAG TPA: AAA family ATPase, partial [Verrucomicrobiae bacterium]|nr:AAA family ATPase [Verrucomicrobiae bacterium]
AGEMQAFLPAYFAKLKSNAEEKLKAFEEGLQELWKSGRVTAPGVQTMLDRMQQVPRAQLAPDLVLVRKHEPLDNWLAALGPVTLSDAEVQRKAEELRRHLGGALSPLQIAQQLEQVALVRQAVDQIMSGNETTRALAGAMSGTSPQDIRRIATAFKAPAGQTPAEKERNELRSLDYDGLVEKLFAIKGAGPKARSLRERILDAIDRRLEKEKSGWLGEYMAEQIAEKTPETRADFLNLEAAVTVMYLGFAMERQEGVGRLQRGQQFRQIKPLLDWVEKEKSGIPEAFTVKAEIVRAIADTFPSTNSKDIALIWGRLAALSLNIPETAGKKALEFKYALEETLEKGMSALPLVARAVEKNDLQEFIEKGLMYFGGLDLEEGEGKWGDQIEFQKGLAIAVMRAAGKSVDSEQDVRRVQDLFDQKYSSQAVRQVLAALSSAADLETGIEKAKGSIQGEQASTQREQPGEASEQTGTSSDDELWLAGKARPAAEQRGELRSAEIPADETAAALMRQYREADKGDRDKYRQLTAADQERYRALMNIVSKMAKRVPQYSEDERLALTAFILKQLPTLPPYYYSDSKTVAPDNTRNALRHSLDLIIELTPPEHLAALQRAGLPGPGAAVDPEKGWLQSPEQYRALLGRLDPALANEGVPYLLAGAVSDKLTDNERFRAVSLVESLAQRFEKEKALKTSLWEAIYAEYETFLKDLPAIKDPLNRKVLALDHGREQLASALLKVFRFMGDILDAPRRERLMQLMEKALPYTYRSNTSASGTRGEFLRLVGGLLRYEERNPEFTVRALAFAAKVKKMSSPEYIDSQRVYNAAQSLMTEILRSLAPGIINDEVAEALLTLMGLNPREPVENPAKPEAILNFVLSAPTPAIALSKLASYQKGAADTSEREKPAAPEAVDTGASDSEIWAVSEAGRDELRSAEANYGSFFDQLAAVTGMDGASYEKRQSLFGAFAEKVDGQETGPLAAYAVERFLSMKGNAAADFVNRQTAARMSHTVLSGVRIEQRFQILQPMIDWVEREDSALPEAAFAKAAVLDILHNELDSVPDDQKTALWDRLAALYFKAPENPAGDALAYKKELADLLTVAGYRLPGDTIPANTGALFARFKNLPADSQDAVPYARILAAVLSHVARAIEKDALREFIEKDVPLISKLSGQLGRRRPVFGEALAAALLRMADKPASYENIERLAEVLGEDDLEAGLFRQVLADLSSAPDFGTGLLKVEKTARGAADTGAREAAAPQDETSAPDDMWLSAGETEARRVELRTLPTVQGLMGESYPKLYAVLAALRESDDPAAVTLRGRIMSAFAEKIKGAREAEKLEVAEGLFDAFERLEKRGAPDYLNLQTFAHMSDAAIHRLTVDQQVSFAKRILDWVEQAASPLPEAALAQGTFVNVIERTLPLMDPAAARDMWDRLAALYLGIKGYEDRDTRVFQTAVYSALKAASLKFPSTELSFVRELAALYRQEPAGSQAAVRRAEILGFLTPHAAREVSAGDLKDLLEMAAAIMPNFAGNGGPSLDAREDTAKAMAITVLRLAGREPQEAAVTALENVFGQTESRSPYAPLATLKRVEQVLKDLSEAPDLAGGLNKALVSGSIWRDVNARDEAAPGQETSAPLDDVWLAGQEPRAELRTTPSDLPARLGTLRTEVLARMAALNLTAEAGAYLALKPEDAALETKTPELQDLIESRSGNKLEAAQLAAQMASLLAMQWIGDKDVAAFAASDEVKIDPYKTTQRKNILKILSVVDLNDLADETVRRSVQRFFALVRVNDFFGSSPTSVEMSVIEFIVNSIIGDEYALTRYLVELNPAQPLMQIIEAWLENVRRNYNPAHPRITALRDTLMLYNKVYKSFAAASRNTFFARDLEKILQAENTQALKEYTEKLPQRLKDLDQQYPNAEDPKKKAAKNSIETERFEHSHPIAAAMVRKDPVNLKHLVTILLLGFNPQPPKYAATFAVFEKTLDVLAQPARLKGATREQILAAIADIVVSTKTDFRESISNLLKDDYAKLVNNDVERFKQLGIIIGYTGSKGFFEIPFTKLRAKYNIKEGSAEEGRLLGILAQIARVAKEGTGGLVEEAFGLYNEQAGSSLDDLNTLLRAFSYFVRVVNFHADFEQAVASGDIGKVNNETYYVSLRDLKRTMAIVQQNFARGMDAKEAVAAAVKRRYYNRLSVADRDFVRELMARNRLIKEDELFDMDYDIQGFQNGSRSIKIFEKRKPQEQKFQRVQVSPGEFELRPIAQTEEPPKLILEIPLDQPLENVDPKIVFNETTRKNLSALLSGLQVEQGKRFNPVMEFGPTAGGKSTMARLAAQILGVGYTRIQINERTDEFDLFGSFQPYEVRISLEQTIKRLEEALRNNEFNALEKVLSRMKKGEEGVFWNEFFTEDERREILGKGASAEEAKRQAIRERIKTRITRYLEEARRLLAYEEGERKIQEQTGIGEQERTAALAAYRQGQEANAEKIREIKSIAYMMDHQIGLRFVEGRFLKAYRKGDLILLDEVNLANEEMLGVLYQLLTLGYLEYNGEVIEPENGRPARVVATANPSSYSSRKRMSEAFMNRFEIVYVDEMTDEEMRDVLVEQMKRALVAGGKYKEDDFAKKEGDTRQAWNERVDAILTQEYGITQEALRLIAKTQITLSSMLDSGSFPRMGEDAHYVFTLRNLERIFSDVRERKAAGLPVSLKTWIRESYAEYAGVLMRSPVHAKIAAKGETPDPASLWQDPDYKSIAGTFSTMLGELLPRKNGESYQDAFDNIILEEFKAPAYKYDAAARTIALDGLVTHGSAPADGLVLPELVDVDSTRYVWMQVLKGLRRNIPTLLIGQSGGGKTEAIGDVAQKLGLKYVSVSLGDATLESLIGSMDYDRIEKRFVYRPGILVRAMNEGWVLVLEELNMAKSGVLEVLNEFFDEGTFTNPYETDPARQKITPHPNFRLFATMNPIQGQTGTNAGRVTLSPALRNRFREVWVPAQKSPEEMRKIVDGILGQAGIGEVSGGTREKLLDLFYDYQKAFENTSDPVLYTSMRDLKRVIRGMAYAMRETGMPETQAFERAVHRIYRLRMQNAEDLAKVDKILGERGIGIPKTGDLSYKYEGGELKVFDAGVLVARYRMDAVAAKLRQTVEREIRESGETLAPEALERRVHDRLEREIREANLIESQRTKRNLLALLEGMALFPDEVSKGRFNPMFLLGETAGGKSSIARYLSIVIFQQAYTRIQFNERTDEVDLFGSFEPREIKMDFDRAYRIVQNAVERGEWIKIKKAFKLWKAGAISAEELKAFEALEQIQGRKEQFDAEAARRIQAIIAAATSETGDAEEKARAQHQMKVLAHLVDSSFISVELEFREGRLLSALRRGDTVVLDEINLANEEILALLYQFLTQGYVEYYNKDTHKIDRIYPAPGFKLIATANPFTYAGRNRLSEALMNRFEVLFVENMDADEMAEIVKGEVKEKPGFKDDAGLADTVKKLAELQIEINKKLQGGAFPGVGGDQAQGYLFTLRNLKRVVRSAEELMRQGAAGTASEHLVRQAYLEYLGILGRSDAEIALLKQLFGAAAAFPSFNPDVPVTFEDTGGAAGVKIGGFTIPRRSYEAIEVEGRHYKAEPEGSKDAEVIEELEEGPLTNLIRHALALGLLDQRHAVLLVGQSGGGKTEIIGDLARRLAWRYRSVSLGNAVLESLVGSYAMDQETRIFRYVLGILVQAMEEGSILVLEELNMAPSGLLEILNEYFDEGTFTNPMTGKKVKIHPNFRLFATMNPEQGVTGVSQGRSGLSPALRSRFSEVWVPHEKSRAEVEAIIRRKFNNRSTAVSEETVRGIYVAYQFYQKLVETGTIGEENNEGYYASLRDVAKVIDLMAQDIQAGTSEQEALRFALKRVFYIRLNNDGDRARWNLFFEKHWPEITKNPDELAGWTNASAEIAAATAETPVTKKAEYVWTAEGGKYVVTRSGRKIFEVEKKVLKDRGFVMTPSAMEHLGYLVEGMQRSLKIGGQAAVRTFNPMMLFGETSGGKSTLVELAASILKQPMVRIQTNQRTDEFDLLGSYHPVEVTLTPGQAYEVVNEALTKDAMTRMTSALGALRLGDEQMRKLLAIPEMDEISHDDLVRRFVREFVLEGGQVHHYPRNVEIMRAMGVLLINGVAGVDLQFKKGIFLDAMGDRDLGIPGKVVLLDEVNLANEEAIGILYQLLTLGYIEYQGRKIYPGEGFQLFTSGNPSTYSGRKRMSEAFMNRFEILYIPELEPEEMVQILMEKYDLSKEGLDDKEVRKLVDLQKEIRDISMKDAERIRQLEEAILKLGNELKEKPRLEEELTGLRRAAKKNAERISELEGEIQELGKKSEEKSKLEEALNRVKQGFDEFNLDNTYRFALRNLERVVRDFKVRRAADKGKKAFDQLMFEAWIEYAGLLSQTTSMNDKRKNNLATLAVLFKEKAGFEVDPDKILGEFKVATVAKGQEEWRELNGVRVKKLSADQMLQSLHLELAEDFRSGALRDEHGGKLPELTASDMERILREADRQLSQTAGSRKDVIRRLAAQEYGRLLNGVPEGGKRLKKLLDKHFYTQAERIEPLVELKSQSLVRTQLLKGFRDGGVIRTVDTDGTVRYVHKSQPVLYVGQSGGGKTEMIADEARELNWPYISVALGSATIESLIGTFVLNPDTRTLEFRKGILIRAMEEGYAIVLEELNMADSSVIEVLNEYFDRGTMTIQERNVPVNIHENFRLFATMNPTEGRTGRNTGRIPLSPALRSRFREVWVRSEREKSEQYRMMLGGIHGLVADLLAKGLPEEDPNDFLELEFDWARRRMQEMAGSVVGFMGGDGARLPVPRGVNMERAGAVVNEVRMAEPAAPDTPADERGPAKPSQKEWQSMSREQKKKIFEEQFRIISPGKMNIMSSDEYFKGREHHWAFVPSTNTLIYNSQELETLSLDALLGVATHESMHRLVTRYTALFGDFIRQKSLAGQFFNILEDGRIEIWARYLYKGVHEPLQAINNEIVFGKYKDDDEMVESMVVKRKVKKQVPGAAGAPAQEVEEEKEVTYVEAIANFFLWLGKRSADPGSDKILEKFLKAMEGRDPKLRADMEELMRAGYLSFVKHDDMIAAADRGDAQGVFSAIPLTRDEYGHKVNMNPKESQILERAIHQGMLIQEFIMPKVYEWAVKSAQQKGKGKGQGQPGQGEPGEQGEGEPGEGEPSEGQPGQPQPGKPQPGKPGQPQPGQQPGQPASKDWKKIWDSLPDEVKNPVEESVENASEHAKDRTQGDAEDFKKAQQQTAAGPLSTRDAMMQRLGRMITELAGYLRDLIENTSRPREQSGFKSGKRLDMQRFRQFIMGTSTNMNFWYRRMPPTKKNVKFTLIVDESGSMSGMDEPGHKAGSNAAGKGYYALMGAMLLAEVLKSLDIDFAIRGYGDNTFLHKRFKNQQLSARPTDQRSGHPPVPDRYDKRTAQDIVEDMHHSIGNAGGNNEGPALTAALEDAERAGGEHHYVIVITDGMGQVDDIQRILKDLRDKRGMTGSTHTEVMALGLGSDTEAVPEVYGGRHSSHLNSDEIDKLPAKIKGILQTILRGVYGPEGGAGGMAGRLAAAGALGLGEAFAEMLAARSELRTFEKMPTFDDYQRLIQHSLEAGADKQPAAYFDALRLIQKGFPRNHTAASLAFGEVLGKGD